MLEEAGIAAGVLWGLPRLGVNVPLPAVIAIMVAWGVFSVIMYRIGSRVLEKPPLVGLPAMIGSKGKVVNTLNLEGLVKIKNELWAAKSLGEKIKVDEEITVVGQDGLRLIVRKISLEENR